MINKYDPNLYEHDYIIGALDDFRAELLTDKPVAEITDKYACLLTAFMRGQISNAVSAMMD